MKTELEALKKVISSRGKRSSDEATRIEFNGTIDDDEVLLRAFIGACEKNDRANSATSQLEKKEIPRDKLI